MDQLTTEKAVHLVWSVMCVLALNGCISKAQLDTARSLPAGEGQWTVGLSGGYLDGAAYSYARHNPRFESQSSAQVESYGGFPFSSAHFIYSYGLTEAIDVFGGLDMLPAPRLGAKIGLLGDEVSVYALAIRPWVAYAGGGFSLESWSTFQGEIAIPNTLGISSQFDLTVTPRMGAGWFSRTDPYGDQDLEGEETMTARAWMWGANLGLAHYPDGEKSSGQAVFFEVSVTRFPSFELNEEGGVEVTFAVGLRASRGEDE
ncbi:MAG: hypothetical protein ACQEVA_01165 [Myxococcota bacterium]